MMWKRTREVFWALPPNVLQEVLEQIKVENKGIDAVSAILENRANSIETTTENNIAVIPIHGPLQKTGNIFSQLFGFSNYASITQDILEAINAKTVQGIVLDIDSPGGEVNGCSELAKIVSDGTKYKPIIAYGSGDIASGAYWIASAANKIIASETSSIGSIGVVGVYNKQEDDVIEIVSSQSPLKRVTPETEEGKKHIQERIDDIADVFITTVAKNRGVTKDEVISKFGSGGVLIGQKAQKAGLIDEIGTLSSVISSFVNKKSNIMEKKVNISSDKKSFKKAFFSGKTTERDRILSILEIGFKNNVSKDFLKTAIEAELDVSIVSKLLANAPKEESKSKTSFESLMKEIKNPKIESSRGDLEEDFDVIAKSIANVHKI